MIEPNVPGAETADHESCQIRVSSFFHGVVRTTANLRDADESILRRVDFLRPFEQPIVRKEDLDKAIVSVSSNT